MAWSAIAVTKRAANCGHPLGAQAYRFDNEGRRVLAPGSCETCGDASCPVCGKEVALLRWAKSTLALAKHEAEGGQIVFVSIAGQHGEGDSIEETAKRLKAFCAAFSSKNFEKVRREIGWVASIRRIEPTFGGRNGCHPNAHYALLLRGSWDDLDARAAYVQDRLVTRWAEWAVTEEGEPHPVRWPVWRRFASESAVQVVAAGASCARYLAKLEGDGGEVAGVAFELVDPAGRKSSTGNVGDRAATGWVTQRLRHEGYVPRNFRAGIVEVPDVAEVVAQFREWRRATFGWEMFRPSHRLFRPWVGLKLEELLAAASAVASADDWAAVRRVLGLGDPDPDPDPDRGLPFDAVGGPFDDTVAPEPPPERDPEHVWVDQPVLWAWWEAHRDDQALGGMVGAFGRSIALDGPWRTVLAALAASQRLGDDVVVLSREGDDAPVLWVAERRTAVDYLEDSAWSLLDLTELVDNAGRSPAWELTPITERLAEPEQLAA